MADTVKRVVILGAGYGGIRAALDLSARFAGGRDVEITLVNKHDYHQFLTELHKEAAGTTSASAVRVPLREILAGRGTILVKGTITSIDRDGHVVQLEDGRSVPYDKLIMALGSDPEFFNVPGLAEHSFTIRSLNAARLIRNHIEKMMVASRSVPADERRACLTFVVAGGGLTGVEFAGELADALPELAVENGVPWDDVAIINVEAAQDIMAEFDPELVTVARKVLEEKGVTFMTGKPITEVTPGTVRLGANETIQTRTVVWAGGVRGARLVQESGFAIKGRGRAAVNGFLQSMNDPDVWIIGDSAMPVDPETGNPVGPTAHHAIDQGAVAAHNVAAALTEGEMREYRPKELGAVASLGRAAAVGNIGSFKAIGRTASLLKEAISLKYLYSIGGPRLVFRRLRGGGS